MRHLSDPLASAGRERIGLQIARLKAVKNVLLLIVLALLGLWWFKGSNSSSDSTDASGRTSTSSLTAPARRVATPPSVSAQQSAEAERQRRKALADEYARLRAQSEAKEAAYKEAMARYEAQRNAISDQIDALGRSNKNGVNQAQIDQLTEMRLRIPLPQRP